MREAGVAGLDLPVLELVSGGAVRMIFRPRGLWIIGTNGRIDLTKGNELFVLIDNSDLFAPPDWEISPYADRFNPRPFDRQSFAELAAR